VLANDIGDRTTASWVAFTEDGERLVGDGAKNQAAMNPERTLNNIKRIIGRTFAECKDEIKRFPFTVTEGAGGKPMIEVEVQGEVRKMTPEQISAMVLTKMKETAETALGCPVTKAVVTVPAYFNDAQRRLTKDAGSLAGLEVLRIINEPTAAALAYGLDKEKEEGADADAAKTILVFDLGGGTFDVSLLNIDGGMFNVLATAGDTHLGGEDFDSSLADWVAKEVQRKQKIDPFTGNGRNMRRLRAACENCKRTLSSAQTAKVEFTCGDDEINVSVSRAKFEQLNEAIFQRCIDAVKRCMLDAKREKTEVDEIVLVGGSTRVPRVQAILSEYFDGKQLNKSVHPDEAVAYGAAVQGAILSGVRDASTSSLLLVDVIPLSLGVECEGREFSRVVNRNTAIPCRKTKEFTTVEDFQTEVDMRVFEGERNITDGNNLLGEFKIAGIQRAKRGEAQVVVTFEVNANGLLTCMAEDKTTGAKAQVEIDNKHGQLSPEEMERMMKEAEKYRAQDESRAKQAEERREKEYYQSQSLDGN
jgi:L1 cell adhesion molecule like protein